MAETDVRDKIRLTILNGIAGRDMCLLERAHNVAETLAAEIAESFASQLTQAREALKPFADLWARLDAETHVPDYYIKVRWEKTIWGGTHDIAPGDLRHAASLLRAKAAQDVTGEVGKAGWRDG